MPNEIDEKNNGAQAPAGDGSQPGNQGAGSGGGSEEETIIIKKSEFEQIKSDRDNYRQMGLEKKARERSLENNQSADDKGGKGGDGQSLDENKFKEIARTEASSVMSEIYKSNELRAKRAIIQKYGELLDDNNWAAFLTFHQPRRGRGTLEDMMDDFEDTMLLYKRSTGKLEEHFNGLKEEARRTGRIEGMFNSAGTAGNVGDKNQGGSGGISPQAEQMARRFGNDPKKVEKINLSQDRQIETP